MRKPVPVALTLLLLVSVGLGVRSVAQQTARDGVWQAVSREKALGDWRVESPPAETSASPTEKASSQAKVRDVPPGTAIASALSPNDTDVEVHRAGPPPFVHPSGAVTTKELEAFTRASDAVVVARAIKASPSMTDASDWINTKFDFEVLDVLKRGEGLADLSPGSVFSTTLDGGTMQVGLTRVTAVKEWSPLPEIGKEYLYFLMVRRMKLVAQNKIVREPELAPIMNSSGAIYELRGAGLTRIAQASLPRPEAPAVDMLDSNEGLSAVRNAARLSKAQ